MNIIKTHITISSTLYFIVLLICFHMQEAAAQTQVYPVSVTTQISPPYSVNLADYAAPGSEQMKVIVLQRDLTQPQYRLYLKMEIELNGRIIVKTSPAYVPPAFVLEPGIPTLISGSSLSPYFDPANMEFTGYSREQYMRTKLFPEGAYVITFTAYDWTRRDVALSNGGSFYCYLAKTDPPILNLPINNALVQFLSPQYINFRWLSRNLSSPNSVFSTRYRLELFEMRVGGISPSEVVTRTRPIFSAETDRTNLIYSIAEPVLEKGMRYVWRVKAFDAQGKDLIRNNGFSEVFSFVYGEGETGVVDFSAVGNFKAQAVNPRKAKLSWDVSSSYDSYRIYYRKQGNSNKWYESETVRNSTEINGLSPGSIYECKVQGKRGNAWGSFSITDTVGMPLIPVIECGSPFTPPEVSNREPLLELMRLQEFDAGGFMVTVADPYALTTAPGRFTGKGFVQVPLFGHKKIRCEFTNIFINTDFRMVDGSIRLLTDSNDGKNALWDIDEVFEGGSDNGTVIEGTEEVSLVIPDIVISDAGSLFFDTASDEIFVLNELQDTTLRMDISGKLRDNPGTLTVQDSEGNLYSVDTKRGKATSLGKIPPLGGAQQLATLPSVVDTRKGKVVFESIPGQTRFAFDVRSQQYARSNIFSQEYKTMKTEDDGLYDIPYKLIPAGETDVVLARVELKNKSIKTDSIIFRSGTGTVYKTQSSGKTGEYLLTLPSGKANDGIEVSATFTDSKGRVFVLGRLIVMSYEYRKPELVLVPVNGNGTDTDPATVKEMLDKVYLPVAVDWQVSLDKSDFKVHADSLDIKGSGMFSMYTDGMKTLNNAFIVHKGQAFDPSAVYLFLLQVSGEESATGDMPRSKQFGYVFTRTAGSAEAINRTIAHEIAHGAFSLSHTFDSKYDIDQGTTSNLLDYTSGTDLVKHQWDAIHDPGLVIGMFERDEEGMYKIIPDPIWIQRFIEQYRYSYVNKKSFNVSKDGFPYFGHYATNLILLDGNSYAKINVTIRENISAIPLKIYSQLKGGMNCYAWGKVLEIYTKDNDSDFSNYLYPTEIIWNSQMNLLASQIGSVSTSKDALYLLTILPVTEYYRLSPEAVVKCLGLIADKFTLTNDYLGSVNDEQIVINLTESCKSSFEKKKALLLFLAKGNAINNFIFHLDGYNLKSFLVEVAKYTNEIIPPDILDVTQERFNSLGITYSHVFDWKESFGPDAIFESENIVANGDFVISSKTDWLAFMQESQYIMRIEPFEYVAILADDAAPYIPEMVKPNETLVMIPAFLFHWLVNQKEREQVIKDLSTTFDLGLSVATLGTYSAGKLISKVSVKTAEGMIMDFVIQTFLNTLDGTPVKDVVSKIDFKNVAWSGASANIDNSKISMTLSCLRNASRGILNPDNNSIKSAIINGGWECGYDIFLSFLTKGIVKAGDKYFEIVLKKLEVSPEFVTKRLLKYGINKIFIQDLWGKVVKTEIQQRINIAIKEYEEGKTE